MVVLSEKAANQRSCPFTLVPWETDTGAVAGVTRDLLNSPMTKCLADECMAWRWVNHTEHGAPGYCGLAGPVAPLD